MFKWLKKKNNIKYQFIGFDLKFNPHTHGFDELRTLQDLLWQKVYLKENLINIQQSLNQDKFKIDVFNDFVFIEFPRPENEEVTMNVCLGFVVNEISSFENDYSEVSDSDIKRIFEELKQYGVIIGPKSIASKLQYKNLQEIQSSYSEKNMGIQNQFSYIDVNIRVRNELVCWYFNDTPKFIEESEKFKVQVKEQVSAIKAKRNNNIK